MRKLLLLVALTAALTACKRGIHGAQTSTATETIAPAAAKPAPTGTEAMTQTVDIEDSRTDAEGGGLTQTTTTTAVKKKTGAAAAARKQPTSKSRPAGRTQ